jgi:hypothetical protein
MDQGGAPHSQIVWQPAPIVGNNLHAKRNDLIQCLYQPKCLGAREALVPFGPSAEVAS